MISFVNVPFSQRSRNLAWIILAVITVSLTSPMYQNQDLSAQDNVKNIDARVTKNGAQYEFTIQSVHQMDATARKVYQRIDYVSPTGNKSANVFTSGQKQAANTTTSYTKQKTLNVADIVNPIVGIRSGNTGSAEDSDPLDVTAFLGIFADPAIALLELEYGGVMGMKAGVPGIFYVSYPNIYWQNPDFTAINATWQNADKLRVTMLHPGGAHLVHATVPTISAAEVGFHEFFFEHFVPMMGPDPYLFPDGKLHFKVEPLNAGTMANPKKPDGTVLFPDFNINVSP